MLKQEFVPVVFNTVNKSLPGDSGVWTNVFKSWVCEPRAALPLESRLPGTKTMCFFAASGRPIEIAATTRSEPLEQRLSKVLAAFEQLPETDRKPADAKKRLDLSQLKYASGGGRYRGDEPPPGRLVLRAYNRILSREANGGLHPAKINRTQFLLGEGGACVEGHPKFKAERSALPEPIKDMFWLTEAEWRTLVPAGLKKGDVMTVPRSASRRLFLWGCHNWWAAETLIRLWRSDAIKHGDLTATVVAISPAGVTLKLAGDFDMVNDISKPKTYRAAYKGQVSGVVHYDRAKEKFTRFDMLVLGDFQGVWYCRSNLDWGPKPVPLAFAFQLAEPGSPADDVIPIGLNKGGKLYWNSEEK
jgi:hypothetical protein